MHYLLSIECPDRQREVLALLAQFADVTVRPLPTTDPVAPHLHLQPLS